MALIKTNLRDMVLKLSQAGLLPRQIADYLGCPLFYVFRVLEIKAY